MCEREEQDLSARKCVFELLARSSLVGTHEKPVLEVCSLLDDPRHQRMPGSLQLID